MPTEVKCPGPNARRTRRWVGGLGLLLAAAPVLAQSAVDDVLRRADAKSEVRRNEGSDGSVSDTINDSLGKARSKISDIEEREKSWRASPSRSDTTSGDAKGGSGSARRDAGSAKPAAAARPAGPATTQRVRTFWLLKGEQEQVIAVCGGSGKEVGYTYFVKTGRYCTPMMSCNTDEAWVQRALCQ